MPDDLLQVLTRFHREIVLPDVQRIVEDAIGSSVGSLRDEMYTLFDGIYVRMDRSEMELAAVKAGLARSETELAAVKAGLARVEARLTTVESRLTTVESRLANIESESKSIKTELVQLEARLARVEAQLVAQPELIELKQQVTILNERLAELEAHF